MSNLLPDDTSTLDQPATALAQDLAPPRPQWTEQDLKEAQEQQFHLAQMQIMNWGTFSRLHVFDISELGHLLVGPSGSGKSTILDAHAALMALPNSEFNAAARATDKVARDRSMVTYVRGAWATNESDEGLIAAQYLRSDTTLSAVAETFTNSAGQILTLVGLWWIKSKSTLSKDVHSVFLVLERSFSLKELSFFLQADYNVRALTKTLPDAAVFPTHSAFRERFKARLGIDHDLALRLLHRTQSSKNLGDLNAFMRDNMLDEPQTFAIAKELCDDFNTLSDAHGKVVDARKQRDLLLEASTAHEQCEQAQQAVKEATTLLGKTDHYREYLQYKLRLDRLADWRVDVGTLRASLDQSSRNADSLEKEVAELMRQRADMDDGDIHVLNDRLTDKKDALKRVKRSRAQMSGWLKTLGWTEPTTVSDFGRLTAMAQQLSEKGEQADEQGEWLRTLRRTIFEAEEKLGLLVPEVRSLEGRRSNLPGELVAVRDRIAGALRVGPGRLPFAGELLQLRQADARWQGALERLLAPLVMSFLVPEDLYRDVVGWLNANHTGQHVRYLRMVPHERVAAEGPRAPSRMLDVADGEYGQWTIDEIRHHYGDFVCTESVDEFRRAPRAISLQGQIKRGGARHEKNDRSTVDNRRFWYIGFSNDQRKLDLLADIEQANEDKRIAEEQVAAIELKRKKAQEKLAAAENFSQMLWGDVDEAGTVSEIRRLELAIEAAQDAHPEVKDMDGRIEGRRADLKAAQEDRADKAAKLNQLEADVRKLESACEQTETAYRMPLEGSQRLLGLFERGASVSLENLESKRARVRETLSEERNDANLKLQDQRSVLEDRLRSFKREHAQAAADIAGTSINEWDEYARLLEKIRADDLPKFEGRFLKLLNEQSDRHLAKLQQRLVTEKDEIRARMDLVNDALAQAPFNPGTYLRIDNKPRSIPDAVDFRADLKTCLERHFKISATTEDGEEQFKALNAIVARLQGTRAEDERWKAIVLDVRQHVEFIGKEYNEQGRVVNIYQSGAGKSGGQRQKLTATCLAAALRYQLAGTERPLPQFCTVFMDEAFDKADSDFTALTLNIFTTFGFQMVMATPMKAVRTLEPFIGGAHVFTNTKDGDRSSAVSIEYDMLKRRLVGLGSAALSEAVSAHAVESGDVEHALR